MGTELGMAKRVAPPFFRVLGEKTLSCSKCASMAGDEFTPELDLSGSVLFPGPLHVVHNIMNGLSDILQESVSMTLMTLSLQQIARLLTSGPSKGALNETCLDGGVAKQFHSTVHATTFCARRAPCLANGELVAAMWL